MLKLLCAVYDTKAGVYSNPFTSLRIETAVRDFAYAAQDQLCDIGRNPADYDLYILGTYEDTEGKITLNRDKEFLANGLMLKNPGQDQTEE